MKTNFWLCPSKTFNFWLSYLNSLDYTQEWKPRQTFNRSHSWNGQNLNSLSMNLVKWWVVIRDIRYVMSVCIKDLCCRPYVYNHVFSLFEQTLVRNLSIEGMEGCIYTTESHWLSNGKIGHVFFSFIFSVKIKGGPELKVGQLDREHLWLRCEFVIDYW